MRHLWRSSQKYHIAICPPHCWRSLLRGWEGMLNVDSVRAGFTVHPPLMPEVMRWPEYRALLARKWWYQTVTTGFVTLRKTFVAATVGRLPDQPHVGVWLRLLPTTDRCPRRCPARCPQDGAPLAAPRGRRDRAEQAPARTRIARSRTTGRQPGTSPASAVAT
jgi:hypothetical protein